MIESYLNIFQIVKIGMHKHEWKWLEKEVPQGSIHGPDSFNIFRNDLICCPDGLDWLFILY